MSKNKQRKPLKEKGIKGAIRMAYSDDKIVVDFHFIDSTILPNLENFSEKTVIDFVATSYYKSCLTLLKQVSNYEHSNKFSQMDNCAYRYLPAMYCFRHYVELKLKYLYMHFANESFNVNSHSLSDLLRELKDKGFSNNVFDEPIAYIESLEVIQNNRSHSDAYFRYLVDKNIICQESLEIPMFEFSKIRTFIADIEYYTNQSIDKLFTKNLLNSRP